jgi:hypothetical protein
MGEDGFKDSLQNHFAPTLGLAGCSTDFKKGAIPFAGGSHTFEGSIVSALLVM